MTGDTPPVAASDDPFPDDLRAAFLHSARLVPVRKGHVVIAEGSAARDVYLICEGLIRFSLVSAQGREVILREFGPGRIFGELTAIDGLPRSVSAVALEDGRLAHMPGDAFLAFLGEVPQAGLWMAQQLAARVRDLTARTFELATMPVATRVQSELLRLAAAQEEESGASGPGGDGGSDRIRIAGVPTHAEMAARIGTHREAVSRELSQLAKEGLVRQTGRALEILSLDGLRALHARMRR